MRVIGNHISLQSAVLGIFINQEGICSRCKIISFMCLWKNGRRLLQSSNFVYLRFPFIKTLNKQLELIFAIIGSKKESSYAIQQNFYSFLLTIFCINLKVLFYLSSFTQDTLCTFAMNDPSKEKGVFSSVFFFEENKLHIFIFFLPNNFVCSVEHQNNGAYSFHVLMNWLEFIPMQLTTKRLRHLSIFPLLFSGYMQ